MTNAELFQKIRAEIERLKGICTAQIKANPGQTFPFVMEMTGYDKLLSFLDTLESEKPVSADLEKAAEEYAYRGMPDEMKQYVKPIGDEVIKNFIAGAKWMAEQLKK